MPKCDPLNCALFKRAFEKLYDKIPVDIIVIGCPHRRGMECLQDAKKKKGI